MDASDKDIGYSALQPGILVAALFAFIVFVLVGVAPLFWLSSTCARSFLNPGFLGLPLAAAGFTHIGLTTCLFGSIAMAYQRQIRWRDVGKLAVIVLVLTGTGLAAGPVARWGTMQRLTELVSQLQPTVDAIHRFEHDHGQAPHKLADLVPNYLASEPDAGLCREHFALAYDGHAHWRLQIDLWTDRIEPVYLIYDSDQQREPHGLRRIGDWGFVKER